MALDQSALLELAVMVQRADGGDRMRTLLETMLQASTRKRPPTSVSDTRTSAPTLAPPSATAAAPRP